VPLSPVGLERARVEIDFRDDVVDDVRADIFRLLQHLFHHPRPLHGIGIAWIVLDFGRDHQLAALFHAGDEDRLQHGACGVDGGGVAGGAGPDDQDRAVFAIAHGFFPSLGGFKGSLAFFMRFR
jgi:hypothetical protein